MPALPQGGRDGLPFAPTVGFPVIVPAPPRRQAQQTASEQQEDERPEIPQPETVEGSLSRFFRQVQDRDLLPLPQMLPPRSRNGCLDRLALLVETHDLRALPRRAALRILPGLIHNPCGADRLGTVAVFRPQPESAAGNYPGAEEQAC